MNSKYKKSMLPHLITGILGILLGIFGVFVSVFSDGSGYERLVTILVILIIYGILGIVIGIWMPIKTFIFLPWLALPGVLVLLFDMFKEGFKVFYVPYIILIIIISYFGLYTGRSFKRKK